MDNEAKVLSSARTLFCLSLITGGTDGQKERDDDNCFMKKLASPNGTELNGEVAPTVEQRKHAGQAKSVL